MRKRKTIRRGFALFVSLVMLFGMTFSGVPTFAGEAEEYLDKATATAAENPAPDELGTEGFSESLEPSETTEPPTTTEPSTTEPSTTEPLATEPPTTTEPSTTEPSTTEPLATEPPTTEPPTTESPTTESPTTEPSSKESNDKASKRAPEPSLLSFVGDAVSKAMMVVGPEANTHTYIFKVDGVVPSGENYSQIVKNGDYLFEPEAPEKAGYKFLGWFDGDKQVKFGPSNPITVTNTQEIIANARYEPVYYVAFVYNNEILKTKSVAPNGTVDASGVPLNVTEPGKVFSHWSVTENGTEAFDFSTPITANKTLYAVTKDAWTVTFDSNGGSAVLPTQVEDGDQIGTLESPTRAGYTFKHWSLTEGGTAISPNYTVTENITLYAVWEVATNTSYKVVYWLENAEDDEYTFQEVVYKIGTTGVTATFDSKSYTGFHFGSADNKTISGNGDTVVNVYYERNVYTFTIRCKAQYSNYWFTYSTTQLKYGQSTATKYNAAVAEYPYYSWYTTQSGNTAYSEAPCMPDSNLTIYGRYSGFAYQYTIGYYESGTDIQIKDSYSFYSGSPSLYFTDEDGIDIPGFTVTDRSQWDTLRPGQVSKIYYTRNNYDLTFNKNNGDDPLVIEDIPFDSDISDKDTTGLGESSTYVQNGITYYFAGWYDNLACEGAPYTLEGKKMPAHNLSLYAKWTPEKYTVTFYNTLNEGDGVFHTEGNITPLHAISQPAGHPPGTDFKGWYWYLNGYFVKFDFDTPISGNFKLYPVFGSQTAQVTYDANGGTGTAPVDSNNYLIGAEAQVKSPTGLTAPTNKVFLGWNTADDGSGTTYQPNSLLTVPTDGVTLYAQWGDINTGTFITYDANGGTGGPTTIDLANNATHTIIANTFTRPGYDFTGWNSEADGSGNAFNVGDKVTVDRINQETENILYAQWAPILTVTSGSKSWEYDGNSHIYQKYTLKYGDQTIDGDEGQTTFTLNDGKTVTITPTGKGAIGVRTVSDNEDNNNTFTVGVDDSVAQGTHVFGTLSITDRDEKYEITVVAQSNTGNTYDGTEKSATGFVTLDFTFDGNTYTVSGLTTSNPKSTNVATLPNAISGEAVVKDAYGNNVTAQFTVHTQDGALEITKRTVTLKSADLEKEYDGTALVNGTTALATETGWVSGEGATYTFTGSQLVVGESANAFSYELKAGTLADNYTIDKTEGTLKVTDRDEKYEITVVAQSNTGNTYDGTEKSATGFVTLDFTFDGNTYTVSGLTTSNPKSTNVATLPNAISGEAVVKDAYGNNVTAQFTVHTQDGALEITKRTVTLKSADLEKEYDGTALVNGTTALATETGWVSGEGATYTFTGSQLVVGESANAFSYELKAGTLADNYTIDKTEGTLKVTDRDEKYEITVVAQSNTGNTYDGTEKSATGFVTLDFTFDGNTYTVSGLTTSNPKSTNVATLPNAISGEAVVKDAYGNNVTAQFTVHTQDGALEITKRTVTLKSADLEKEYDGTALVNGTTALATETGWVSGEGATYTFTGSQLVVGESANAFSYELKAGTLADNYTIDKTEGTLKVTDRDEKYEITVVAQSNTGNTYDGTEKSATGFVTLDFTFDGNTYTVSGLTTSNPKSTNVATLPNAISGEAVVKDAYGNNVTAQFTVHTQDGALEITKRTVTLKSADLEKEYDGTALVNGTTALATETGWVSGEGATYTFTGSQLVVGESANAFSYELKAGTLADNYTIDKTEGTLKVTDRDEKYEITVVAQSNTGNTYDGTEKSATGFVTLDFTFDGNTYTVSGLTTSNPKSTNVATLPNAISGEAVVKDAYGNNVTAQFTVHTQDGALEITKRTVTLKSADLEKEYDGTALVNGTTALATETGWVSGEGATYTFTGSQLVVGESANAFSYELKAGTLADNYTIDKTEGTLKVTDRDEKYEITVVAQSNTGNTYDGTEKSATGFVTLDFTFDGNTYTVSGLTTSNPKSTNVATLPNAISGEAVVKDAYGNNVTAQFTVHTQDGALEITKRTVTLKSADLEKEYDGTALVNGTTALATETGWVSGEGATYTFTGSQLVVGESANAFSYELKAGTLADNYTIDKTEGTLKVTDRDEKYEITVVAQSNTGNTYDGTEKSATGFVTLDFTFDGNTYTVSGLTTSNPKSTNVATLPNAISGEAVVKDAYGNNVTAQFTVHTQDGALEITKRTVTLKSADLEKEYDGTALVNGTTALATETGWVSGEGATYTFTGSQLVVGESANAFSYELKAGTLADNYTIDKTEGTLKVTDRDEKYEITVVAQSNTGNTYDGTEKSATGFVTLDFTFDGNTYTVSGLTTSNPKSTNVATLPNAISGEAVVKDAYGNNVTAQFTVHTQDGALEITKRTVTLKSADLEKEYDGTALVNGTTALATETGWVSGEGATYTFTGSQLVVGESANAFSYELKAGTLADNYTIDKTEGTLKVTDRDEKYEITVVAQSNTGNTYDGTEKSATGFVTLDFTFDGNTYTVSGLTTSNPKSTNVATLPNAISGEAVVKDAYGNNVTAQFTVHTQDGALEITKAPVTITTGSDSKPYDGTPLTNATVNIDGLVDGESVTLITTGSQTEVGNSDNTYAIIWDNATAANYTVTDNLGTLTVTTNAAAVTLTAPSAGKTYDGTALTATTGVTASGLPAGFTIEATATGSQTDAGSSANVVDDGYVIKDADGNDKTANFTNVVKVDGMLTVNPKAVTITTGSDSKAYDGTALTEATAEIDGLVDGESVTLSATGSQTEVGSSDNTYDIDWDNAKASNYTVTDNLGKLTVTKKDGSVVLMAPSAGKTYDGTVLTATTGVTASGLPDGFTIEATATGSQTDAGSSANVVDDGYKIFDAEGNDKTENFTNVTKVDGTLTVNPKAVTITTGSDSKSYDGTPLTSATAEIEGLVDGESVTLSATGSQTEVGISDNTYDIDWDNAKASNYTVTDNLGKLTVTDAPPVNVKVEKIWDDQNDAAGIRPDSITINLYKKVGEDGLVTFVKSTVVKPDAEGKWTGEFSDLDKYEDGVEIIYSVEEEEIDDRYYPFISGNADEGFVIRNSIVGSEAVIDIEVDTTWDDADNQDGLRPDSITIRIIADGKVIDLKKVTEADDWKWTFENLPQFDKDGKEIIYTVEQDVVDGYETVIDGYDVINKHAPIKISAKVIKTWSDKEDAAGLRPDSITVRLFADGVDTGKALVLTAKDNWAAGEFLGLDKFKKGVEIVYSVEEDEVDKYTAEIVKVDRGDVVDFSITNCPVKGEEIVVPTTGESRGIHWMMGIGLMVAGAGGLLLIEIRRRKAARKS
ncbi:MAG: Cna B-type domain-containing protein [Saccharofermentanales bacterium]